MIFGKQVGCDALSDVTSGVAAVRQWLARRQAARRDHGATAARLQSRRERLKGRGVGFVCLFICCCCCCFVWDIWGGVCGKFMMGGAFARRRIPRSSARRRRRARASGCCMPPTLGLSSSPSNRCGVARCVTTRPHSSPLSHVCSALLASSRIPLPSLPLAPACSRPTHLPASFPPRATLPPSLGRAISLPKCSTIYIKRGCGVVLTPFPRAHQDGRPALRLASVLPGIDVHADILAHVSDQAALLGGVPAASVPVVAAPTVTGRGFGLALTR